MPGRRTPADRHPLDEVARGVRSQFRQDRLGARYVAEGDCGATENGEARQEQRISPEEAEVIGDKSTQSRQSGVPAAGLGQHEQRITP